MLCNIVEHYWKKCGLPLTVRRGTFYKVQSQATSFHIRASQSNLRGFFYSNPVRVATPTRNVVNGFGYRDSRSVSYCHCVSLPIPARLSLIIDAVWPWGQSAVTPSVNHRGSKGHGYRFKTEGVKG